ncbi:MAG: LysR family transcriptional regulator [Desulfamplus sp.]|nr:LysR family transcriptional regulator [Desulfamplus sp.]MBF0388773.1 LysR family transcriptional regulator [Desulfamplus sp.]
MDLNKLKIFYVLAQVKSYSKCAEKLFVTQSAVSHAIKALEQSLDMKLIERKKRQKGFALTDQGKILFRSCQTIFSEIAKTKEELSKSNGGMEFIRLGSTVEFGMSIILKNIKIFFDNNPNIHIDFRLSHNLFQPLLDDELDMIVDCRPHAHPEIKSIHLFREEYSVIATPEYVKQNKINRLEDLGHCNIISMDSELIWWSNFINVIPVSKQSIFNRVTEINHVRGIIIATLCSIGVGFVPKYTVLRELEQGSLVELFPELDILNDNINIFIKHRNLSAKKNIYLIDFLKTLML